MKDKTIEDTVEEIFARNVIWDAHSGFMPDPAADLEELEQWRRGGVNYLSIDVGFDVMDWRDTIRTIAAFRHWIAAHDDRFCIVESVHQIQAAKAAGKMAVTFDLEGANALDGRVEMVELYHRLGVRQMLLAYNLDNAACGGCHGKNSGLTEFGGRVVDEMNRLGMFVDATHCSYTATMEIMERSAQPVIFSHSNPRALFDHERNILDEQIRACAATGGLIGVVGLENFMGADAEPATLVNHICYLADMVGPDHVGIGLDYSFPVDAPSAEGILERFPDYWPVRQGYLIPNRGKLAPARLREVCAILLGRGMSERDVALIFGGNFMRLAGQIWR